ncbi:MAG: hypothetical protein FJ368_05130 [Pelagibacterales bacterium]|nr:hypothetical protein [Pelagibacterales bacterium]
MFAISAFLENKEESGVVIKENDELLTREEAKDKLLRSNEVKMSFDLMTKSFIENGHPKLTYLTCLAFYNICSANGSLDIISSYLKEDPSIIPNKIKSFLIVHGTRSEKSSEIPEEL